MIEKASSYGNAQMNRIIRAQPEHDFVLKVWFGSGEVGFFDAAPYLNGPICQPLKEAAYFRHVFVDPVAGTICWPNGADFCPDVVHRDAIRDDNEQGASLGDATGRFGPPGNEIGNPQSAFRNPQSGRGKSPAHGTTTTSKRS